MLNAWPDELICAICDRRGDVMCRKCHSICYCSAECRTEDHPLHQLICNSFINSRSTPRPRADYCRAIYFAPGSDTGPCFTWVRLLGPGRDGEAVVAGLPEKRIEGEMTNQYFSTNPVLNNRPLHPEIVIKTAWKNTDKRADIKSNKSVKKIDSELGIMFRGSLLVYARQDKERLQGVRSGAGSLQFLDLGPRDFRYTVDLLRWLFDQSQKTLVNELLESKIMGVRLNCQGDLIFCQRPLSEPTEYRASYSTKRTQLPSDFADKLEVPLIIHTIAPALAWRYRRAPKTGDMPRSPRHNWYYRTLHPPGRENAVGSLDVVRKDGKPFHYMHIRAMEDYCALKTNEITNLCAIMIAITEDAPDNTLRDEVLNLASRVEFEMWYPTWVRKNRDEEWFENVPSPYDI